MCNYLVRQTSGLADDAERKRLLLAQGLQVAADACALDLPLPQVVRKPAGVERRGGDVTNHNIIP